ncbi:MAG: T9SS type A sorting domain-containing protein, partial [Bacteroidota bacterium]
YSCNFYYNGAYHIYNNTSNWINARYNFWASRDSIEIKTHIYDETDNAGKGFVYIRPFIELPYLVTDSMKLSGAVKYANTASSSMNNATLKIKTIGNTEVGSAVTNSSGAFAFARVKSGSYHLTIAPAEPWGGVNSTDALLILFHFSHISLLNSIKLAAADVNNSGFVNATDALLVMKRFVGQIPAFPSGDAFMEIDTLMVNGNQVTNNLKMIWFGDVNGSFIPSVKKSLTSVILSQEGTLYAPSFTEFDLPVKIKKDHDIGAISLGFYYPQEFFEIKGVELKNGSTNFNYSAADGLFRMAWCDLEAMSIHDQETMITLKMKSLNLEGLPSDQLFGIFENSELADNTGAILEGIVLTMPEIKSSSNGTNEISDEFGLKVYPNPFSDQCLIDFTLTRESKIKISLFNYAGEQMKQIDEAIYPKGSHQVRLNSPNLTPGLYLLKIQITANDQACSGIMKVVVSK